MQASLSAPPVTMQVPAIARDEMPERKPPVLAECARQEHCRSTCKLPPPNSTTAATPPDVPAAHRSLLVLDEALLDAPASASNAAKLALSMLRQPMSSCRNASQSIDVLTSQCSESDTCTRTLPSAKLPTTAALLRVSATATLWQQRCRWSENRRGLCHRSETRRREALSPVSKTWSEYNCPGKGAEISSGSKPGSSRPPVGMPTQSSLTCKVVTTSKASIGLQGKLGSSSIS
mmetsp:Transcript_160532/g.515301  ORF Transcript_160532/g.515301 Transcript_160532/m.515301 type:complete len:233 (+) Transcript_160532:1180-1878(+)